MNQFVCERVCVLVGKIKQNQNIISVENNHLLIVMKVICVWRDQLYTNDERPRGLSVYNATYRIDFSYYLFFITIN